MKLRETQILGPKLEKRKEEEAELMPDQNSTGDKVKFCCDKTPSGLNHLKDYF